MSATGYNYEVIFSGEITEVSRTGHVLKCKALPGGRVLDRPVTTAQVQPTCQHALFDAGCALIQAEWTFSATLIAPGVTGWPYTFGLAALAREIGTDPPFTADWFAGGWMTIDDAENTQLVAIVRSTLPVAGVLTVTLNGEPDPFPVAGVHVRLVPGCDKRWQTCDTKFGNYYDGNFRGYPRVPARNPVASVPESTPTGGKK